MFSNCDVAICISGRAELIRFDGSPAKNQSNECEEKAEVIYLLVCTTVSPCSAFLINFTDGFANSAVNDEPRFIKAIPTRMK